MKFNLWPVLLFCLLFSLSGMAQPAVDDNDVSSAAFIFDNDSLFTIYYNVGPFDAADRAEMLRNKLIAIDEAGKIEKDSFYIVEGDGYHDLVYMSKAFFRIYDREAEYMGMDAEVLCRERLEIIQGAMVKDLAQRSILAILTNTGLAILFIGILYLIYWLNFRAFEWLEAKIDEQTTHLIIPQDKLYGFLKDITVEREKDILIFIVKLIKWGVFLFILSFYMPVAFNFSPATKFIADAIYEFLLDPLRSALLAIFRYLPNVFKMFAIVFITHYLLKFLKYLSEEVHYERIKFKNFYKDWARPTFRIGKILIFSFAFIFIFPLLPGADSEAFKGISLFLGALITLGSSTAVANVVAGVVITYMRAFMVGDRVKIGDTEGDVIEKTLLVTKVRTVKNESITIPNVQILNGHMINYSRYARERGLLLYTSVTIGYDVSWKQVHELLIAAANDTQLIEESPEPFVLQTSLDDNYVHYELNAVTKSANNKEKTYSELHAKILDKFNEAGVEILSPHYRAVRDANVLTIPDENIPENYKRSGFLFETLDKMSGQKDKKQS